MQSLYDYEILSSNGSQCRVSINTKFFDQMEANAEFLFKPREESRFDYFQPRRECSHVAENLGLQQFVKREKT